MSRPNIIRTVGWLAAAVLFASSTANDSAAASASLRLSPSSKTLTVGQTFSVTVSVNTDVSINSAEAKLTFSKNILEVTSLSSSGIFTMWAESPAFSNSAGTVSFAGGLPSPGYKGTSGKILTVTFKAKAAGKATVRLTNASVLANDGTGTDVLTGTATGSYTVNAPAPVNTNTTTNTNTPTNTNSNPTLPEGPIITAPDTPDQNKWYATSTIAAAFDGGSGVTGYSVVVDSSPDTTPPDTVTTLKSTYSVDNVPDGIWYLHVRSQGAGGWSATKTFGYRIDATPPAPFTIAIEGDPTLSFAATDATSGLDHYELSLDGAPFATVESPYTTPALAVGTHTVVIRAFDKAGNYREAETSFDVTGAAQPVVIDLTPVLVGNEPLVVRGFSGAQDSIRLTIDQTQYGPYLVAEHTDPNPTGAVPAGMTAWRIEISPTIGAGEHDIQITAIAPDGTESTATPPVKFKILTNVVRAGRWLIPTVLIINVLVILLGLFVLAALFFAIKFFKLRRKLRHSSVDMLQPAKGGEHRQPARQNEIERLEALIMRRAKEPSDGKKPDPPPAST